MGKVVVIGGGWSGVAAAICAKKQGQEVVLLEKTDLLLGLGNVGGIMRNNGRFTATEENIALGANELFDITDKLSVHRNIDFPGHKHASFYDVNKVESEVRRLVNKMDIEVKFKSRVVDVLKKNELEAVQTAEDKYVEGDAFVEATGTSGPMGNCSKYGNGCSMCVLRCPSFGPRVSLTEKAGLVDLFAMREDGARGAFSGSCKLDKSTLSKKLRKILEKDGYAVVPLPESLVNKDKLDKKVCKQYALDEFAKNVILIDTGCAKLMTPYFDLDDLRTVEGFEDVRYVDPYAGGKGNSIRYMSVGLRDEYMRAKGLVNLFLAGEKSGFFVGHTEAITTGSLAGYNAARMIDGLGMLKLPESLSVGAILTYAMKALESEDSMKRRFTFAGGEFFEYMVNNNLYSTDVKNIRKKVKEAGLLNIYNS
ncbi:MAG: FAD-dependent oxidoreductase [Firmicutes bacterium]|nr:FAD-dependent oxidoreductase [Bacillota bacterium]